MIGGRQGTTKNMFLYYIISRVTTGSPWWGGSSTEQQTPGRVILLEAEEDPHTQIKPRLVAAGADCSRVHLIEGIDAAGAMHLRHVALQRDLEQIDQLIRKLGDVDLVAISPITSYMGDVPSKSNEEVRSLILHPLKSLAERYGCALVLIKHPNKEYRNHDPLERIAGSAAFTEAMRAAIIIGTDPSEPDNEKIPRRAAFWSKWSLGPSPDPLSWRVHLGDNGAPAIHFLDDPIDFTAREMLGGQVRKSDQPTKPQRAWEWIEDYLATGPTTMAEMNKAASLAAEREKLFSYPAYEKAKRQAKTDGRLVVKRKPGQKAAEWWVWLAAGWPPDWCKCESDNVVNDDNVVAADKVDTDNVDTISPTPPDVKVVGCGDKVDNVDNGGVSGEWCQPCMSTL